MSPDAQNKAFTKNKRCIQILDMTLSISSSASPIILLSDSVSVLSSSSLTLAAGIGKALIVDTLDHPQNYLGKRRSIDGLITTPTQQNTRP